LSPPIARHRVILKKRATRAAGRIWDSFAPSEAGTGFEIAQRSSDYRARGSRNPATAKRLKLLAKYERHDGVG
jgi:hypothetical protein